MRKLMLLAAMLAMALVAAAPALGQQAAQGFGQESESGEVEVEFSATSEGGNGSSCTPANQLVSSANGQNSQGAVQSRNSESGDFEAEGSSISAGPEAAVECEQSVQQSAAAGKTPPPPPKAPPPPPKAAPKAPPPPPAPGAPKAPPPPPAPKAEAPKAEAPKAEAPKAEAPKAEAKAGAAEAKAEAPKAKELPKTGGNGGASLMALGTGALLVGGGLLIRRIVR